MDNMIIPNNCAECEHTNYCHSPHYGANQCMYNEIISNNTIETLLNKNSV